MANPIILGPGNSPGTDGGRGVAAWTGLADLQAIRDDAIVQPGDSVEISALDNDIGVGISITNAFINGAFGGSVSFDGVTITYDTGTDYDYLLPGEYVVVAITYTITDANGDTANGPIFIRVERPTVLWVDEDDTLLTDQDGPALES